MRYPPYHKQRTRKRILDAAARLFREHGYLGAGVDAVMREAGLTHGGFYSHFANKEALLAAMIGHAVDETRSARVEGCEHATGPGRVRAIAARYLSREHRDHPGLGCPAPPLLSELARSGHEPRQVFTNAIRDWVDEFTTELANLNDRTAPDKTTADRRRDDATDRAQEASMAVIACCVGGLALARAVNDEALSDAVLDACRTFIGTAVGEFESGQRADTPHQNVNNGSRST